MVTQDMQKVVNTKIYIYGNPNTSNILETSQNTSCQRNVTSLNGPSLDRLQSASAERNPMFPSKETAISIFPIKPHTEIEIYIFDS